MATEFMKIETIEKQTVKPASPTPKHLQNFKLSALDQLALETYIPILLFYPNNVTSTSASDNAKAINDRCQHLIQSLAKTLTHFYPLAGRIKGNSVIECNDDGAEFVKARVKCSLSEILEHPDPVMLRQLLPIEPESKEPESKEAVTGRLLLAQVNLFECGGMAIALSISHKIADATTLSTFINCWTATAHDDDDDQSNKLILLPEFGAANLFTPLDLAISKLPPAPGGANEKCTTGRFVFNASKISDLQAKVASSDVPNPTRVESVSALIWKCSIEASSSSIEASSSSSTTATSNLLGTSPIRPSLLSHTVNMRKKAVPPLPENLVGNLVDFSTTEYSKEGDGEIDLKGLVAKIRRGFEEKKEGYKTKVVFDSNEAFQNLNEYIKLIKNDEIDKFVCSSWCRMPFYEADFGWGKPSWVSFVGVGTKNATLLLDKRDCKGIEAWVTLREECMALFETNADLLAYASLNPRAITN